MNIFNNINLSDLLPIVNEAEAAVLGIYNDPKTMTVDYKTDKSPVTNADLLSHKILTKGLSAIDATIPVVSEEQAPETNMQNMKSEAYWLIDPIDGTKDFLTRTGQFTICIALIVNSKSVFGLVAAPALKELYYGGKSYGSYVVLGDEQTPQKLPLTKPKPVIYGGSTGSSGGTLEYIKEYYDGYDVQTVGSQLKFTYVAEGRAAAYPRIASTMKIWDVAAGQAIIEGAGGSVNRPDNSEIFYDGENVIVGDFVAKLDANSQ